MQRQGRDALRLSIPSKTPKRRPFGRRFGVFGFVGNDVIALSHAPQMVVKVLKSTMLRKGAVLVAVALLVPGIVLFSALKPSQQVAHAATTSTLNFQARLLTNAGNLVPDGLYNIEFKLYDASSGGTLLWTDTRYDTNGVTAGNDFRITVKNGYFSVNLADTTAGGTAFPGTIDWSSQLWLTMNIGGVTQTATPTWDGEMSPRILLTGVPYAFSAGQLQATAGGFTNKLVFTTPSGSSKTLTLPNETGTVCTTAATGACSAVGGYVQFAPASAQADSSSNNTIFVNKTGGTGNVLQLQKAGVDVFSIANNGTLKMAQDTWFTATDAAGTGTINVFKVNANNEIQVGAALNIDGGIMLPTDGGQLVIADMPFSTSATAGTVNSYTFGIGQSNALTVYGEADGSGGAQNVRIGIGSGITPTNTLTVNALSSTTNSSGAQAVIGTNGTSNKGLIVQGVGSQSANLIEVQNSSGTILSYFDSNGSLRIGNGGSAVAGFGSVAPTAGRDVSIRASVNTNLALVIGGNTSQSADLIQLQDSTGLINGSFNGTGNQLTLGRIAASGTVTQGKIVLSDGTTDNFSLTLQSATLTSSSKTITFPNETGTVCTTATVCAGYGAATGSFVNLQGSTPGSQQTGNLNLSGTGIIATRVSSALFDSVSGAVGLGTATATGITIGGTSNTSVSIQTAASGAINIGTAAVTGKTINVGSVGTTANATTIHIADTTDATAGSVQTVTIGSKSNLAHITTIQGGNGTGAITLTPQTTGTIIIGATAGSGQITLGSSSTTQTVAIGDGAGAPTVNIANTSVAGATISIAGAANTSANSISIANGASAANSTVSILSGAGTAGVGTLSLGNNVRVTTIDIGNSANVANRTTTINGGATPTGISDTVNIATGNTVGTGSKVVHIADGTPAGTNTVTIGSSAATANVTILQGGTGTGAGTEAIRLLTNSSNGSIALTTGSSSGAINLNSATIVGTAATLALFNTAATNISFAGAATTLSVGAAGGTTTINGSLTVTNTKTFTIGGSGFTSLLGTGLTNSAGVLTVTTTGASGFFQNGGNSFGAGAVLGTNDGNTLILRTNSTTALTVDTSQNISLVGNLTVAANKYISLTGGATGSRPGSPTDGMVFYDTTTKQLLTYDSTLAKWKADHLGATKIVAASNSSQALKDAADYVADGNTGTANDGDQIQINAAITAAAGGTVYLAEGTYTIDNPITVADNTIIAGAGRGTLITLPNSYSTTIDMFDDGSGSDVNITIRDLSIDGNRTNQAAGTINGIGFTNAGTGSGTTTVPGLTIQNVSIKSMRTYGIYLSGVNHSKLSGVTVSDATSYGVYFLNGTYNTVAESNFQGNDYGVFVSAGTYITITGNILANNTNGGVRLDSAGNYNTVTGNTFNANNIGVYVTSSSFNTVTGNTFNAAGSYGIALSAADYNTLSGNLIYNSGNDGMNVSVSSGNIISSNLIRDTAGSTYAINITSSGSVSNYLADNTYGGTGAESIADLGANTRYASQMNAAQVLQSGSSLIKANASTTLTGTGAANNTTTLTGTSTKFTTELQVGDRITVNSQTRTVTVISSNTSFTVDAAFTGGVWSGQTITRFPSSFRVVGSSGSIHMLIQEDGYTGIGTIIPNALLDVAGTGNFAGLLTGQSGLTITGAGSFSSTLTVNSASGTSDNIVIGANAVYSNNANDGILTIYGEEAGAIGSATLQSTGTNFQIGTSSQEIQLNPVNNVQVITGKALRFMDSTNAAYTQFNQSSTSTLTVTPTNSVNAINFDSNTLSIDALNNRIGIGNAAPTVALDVTGAATISGLITGQTGLSITGAAVNLNVSSNFATNINTGSSTGAVTIGNASAGAITLQSASTVGVTAGTTFAVSSTNFNLTTAGVVTLAGGQSTDIATSVSAGTATALTVQPGLSTGASSNGGAVNIRAGDGSGTTAVVGGALNIRAGNATGASGTRTGGALSIDAGFGGAAGTNGGAITLGSTNAASIALGRTGITTTNNGALTVTQATTLSGNVTLGVASTTTGAITFKGSGGAGTLTLQGPTTPNASNYTLTIPTITANDIICVATLGNCSAVGSAGGALTGTFPNPTLAGITTQGAVPFQGASSGILTSDATKFFWDNTSKRLGIGNSAPTVALDVTGAGAFSGGLTLNKTLTVNGGTQDVQVITYATPADTSGTNTSSALNISTTIGNATAGTNTANVINLGPITGDAQVTLRGINVGTLTGTAATEQAINIGTGWDALLAYNGTALFNGTGVLQTGAVSGSYTGITGVGTVTAGTWSGTAIAGDKGGTGQTSYTVGDMLYASSTTALSKLSAVATGSCLISQGTSTAPAWGNCGTLQNAYDNDANGSDAVITATTTDGGILFRDASTTLGTSSLFAVQDNTGVQNYLQVKGNGDINLGMNNVTSISTTVKGTVINDGTTATVSSLATTNGKLYAVVATGSSYTGAAYYGNLTLTTTGPTITEHVQQLGVNNHIRPIVAIGTFTGTGSTINVTATLDTATGSPANPITGVSVIEITGATTVNRNVSQQADAGSGAWNNSITLSGSPVAGNLTLGSIATGLYNVTGASLAPYGSETEIVDTTDSHANGNAAGYTNGDNIYWQIETSNDLTTSWSSTTDEYQEVMASIELVNSVPATGGSVTVNGDMYVQSKMSFGVQTLTITDDGVANDTLTPTTNYVRVSIDETANAGVPNLVLSEVGARDGQILIIVNNELDGTSDTFTINDSAGVQNWTGTTIGPEDAAMFIYMNDRWVGIGGSNN